MNVNKNIMELGVSVLDWTPEPEKYLNDNIHPCVRYIEGGLNGFEWWMVTTPYPAGVNAVEDPILYWGKSRDGNLPPLTWQGGKILATAPSGGYNSDPHLYFDVDGLWVFWREYKDSHIIDYGGAWATFGVHTSDGVTFTDKKFFASGGFDIEGKIGDAEMCPVVINVNGDVRLYGAYNEFAPNRVSYGLGIWDIENNDLHNNTFTLTKKVGLLHKEKFHFWHFDIFEHDSKFYCVVSPESGVEILIGVSEDSENFKFWSTPLLSNSISGTFYLYRPTALVHQGILYMWHPNRVQEGDKWINKIYMSQRPFNDVLDDLDSSVSKVL